MSEVDQGRRSGFLVFAVFLANMFLIGMAGDAALSVADDLFILSPQDSDFFMARAVLALAVVVATILTLFLVIFVPPLPKLVLLPPIVVELWLLFGALPIPWSLADRASVVPLDLIQLGSAAIAFAICKVTTGHWFIAASRLPRKRYLLLRTLVAVPVSLVVGVLLLGGMLIGILVFFLQEETRGYLQFASTGIEVRETVMRRDGKFVHLVATVHFADPKFYREVYSTIPRDALILAEGVTDREGRMKSGVPYGNAARTLGLETQDVFEQLIGPATGDDVAAPATKPPVRGQSGSAQPSRPKLRPDVVRADLDIADFSPMTIRFIGRIGELYSSRNFSEAMQRFSAFSGEFSDADIKLVMSDLIDKRNKKVLAELDKRLANYTTVFIPWGAQHMPDLEARLKARGFRIVSQRMIPLARYGTIFDALWAQTGRRAAARAQAFADLRMARPRGVEPLLQD